MLLPAPGGVNGPGFLGHITKAVRKGKHLFIEIPLSHKLEGPGELSGLVMWGSNVGRLLLAGRVKALLEQ